MYLQFCTQYKASSNSRLLTPNTTLSYKKTKTNKYTWNIKERTMSKQAEKNQEAELEEEEEEEQTFNEIEKLQDVGINAGDIKVYTFFFCI
jgi:hypothetical protein